MTDGLETTVGIIAFHFVYVRPVIGCTWAYGRLLMMLWRDIDRAFAQHQRPPRAAH